MPTITPPAMVSVSDQRSDDPVAAVFRGRGCAGLSVRSIGLLPRETDRPPRRRFVLRRLAEPAGRRDAPATEGTYRGWWPERTGHARTSADDCRSRFPTSRIQGPYLTSIGPGPGFFLLAESASDFPGLRYGRLGT